MKVFKAAWLLIMVLLIQGCAKDKCVVCMDYDGNQTGLKCFKTTEEALEWQSEQHALYPNQPLDCSE